MRYLIIGFLSFVFLASCSTDDATIYEVGSDFIENTVQVREIDTFSIKAGTFKLDSLITSSTNRILVGSVEEPNLGPLTSKSYLELVASTYGISSDAVYDSIGMILHYDNYYYGDTTKIQTYKLHRISETFEIEDSNEYYNTSFLKYDDDTLGEITFTPKPNKTTDSLFIKMDNVLGEEIFNKIVDNDINNSDDFLQYFKGLAIVPDSTLKGHVLGFNAQASSSSAGNSSMRLYYSIEDDDSEGNDYYVDFVISSAGQQFNQIESDLNATDLAIIIDDGEEIKSSEETDDKIFIQSGSGVTARIEIPSIKKLKEISDNGTALSASLTFVPVKGSYNEDNPLPESMLVYIVDHKNRIIQQLSDVDGNTALAYLNDEKDEFNNDVYYSVNLSGFVEQILETDYDYNYALMVQYSDYTKKVNRMIIENDPETDNEVKLTVKYLNY